MRSNPKTPASDTAKPATLKELQALAGTDNDFIVAQLSKLASLRDARSALNDHLHKELVSTRNEIARFQAVQQVEETRGIGPTITSALDVSRAGRVC